MFKMNNYYIGTYEIERAHKGYFFSADSCRFLSLAFLAMLGVLVILLGS